MADSGAVEGGIPGERRGPATSRTSGPSSIPRGRPSFSIQSRMQRFVADRIEARSPATGNPLAHPKAPAHSQLGGGLLHQRMLARERRNRRHHQAPLVQQPGNDDLAASGYTPAPTHRARVGIEEEVEMQILTRHDGEGERANRPIVAAAQDQKALILEGRPDIAAEPLFDQRSCDLRRSRNGDASQIGALSASDGSMGRRNSSGPTRNVRRSRLIGGQRAIRTPGSRSRSRR